MKIIALCGQPATGKSTVMKSLISKFSGWQSLEWHLFKGIINEEAKLIIIGTYATEEKFPGTDRLAMNAQPHVESFLTNCLKIPFYGKFTVIFEGDRLTNSKFFNFIKSNFNHKFFVLEVDEETIKERHASRDNQDSTWLKGRKTKIENLKKGFEMTTLLSNNITDIQNAVNCILEQKEN